MEDYLDHPKIDPSLCRGCPYGDFCALADPNEGDCRRYEDMQLKEEYALEELKEDGKPRSGNSGS